MLLPLPPEEGGEALLPPLPLPRALSTLCCAFWSALPRPVPPCSRARRGARSSAEAGPAEAKRNAAATARRAKAAAARTRERAIVFLLLLLLWVLCGFGEVRLSGAAKGGVVSEERKGRRRKREGERVTRKVRSPSSHARLLALCSCAHRSNFQCDKAPLEKHFRPAFLISIPTGSGIISAKSNPQREKSLWRARKQKKRVRGGSTSRGKSRRRGRRHLSLSRARAARSATPPRSIRPDWDRKRSRLCSQRRIRGQT